jgi:hypothetical protein
LREITTDVKLSRVCTAHRISSPFLRGWCYYVSVASSHPSLLLPPHTAMPHDAHGRRLQIGDRVLVPCTVQQLTDDAEYCNAVLITEAPVYPGTHHPLLSLNTRQVLYVESAAPPLLPSGRERATVPTTSEGPE